MNITLYDPPDTWLDLLPLTYTRPISEIRVGGLTIREKWEILSQASIGYKSEPYLSDIFKTKSTIGLVVMSNVLIDNSLVEAILNLNPDSALYDNTNQLVAIHNSRIDNWEELIEYDWPKHTYKGDINRIEYPWDIFQANESEIKKDINLVTQGRTSLPIVDEFTRCYSPDQIFVEEGVKIRSSVLNAENGPIYLGRNVEIQEGAILQGPLFVAENCVINMGAKIRKSNSFGPFTKVGGEVSNSVIFGYSNKAHDGFLGNSVVGEWCNIGADTNTSNLKNNYGEVRVWNYRQNRFIGSGSQFCGLVMGDHSKCAINTMFNTGSVVGVAANIFGAGFPRTSVPSFAWGGSAGFKTFQFDKAIEASEAMMQRRKRKLSGEDIEVLKDIFERSKKYRIWEKDNS